MKQREGRILWFNEYKGIGVVRSGSEEFFAHYSEIVSKKCKKAVPIDNTKEVNLKVDQLVSFVASDDVHLDLRRATKIEGR